LVSVEHLHQLGKICQRAAETIDLVDHDHIDETVFDILQQSLESGSVQRAPRNTTVVIMIAYQYPSFGPLARDIGLTRLALGMQRVELLLKAFLGGFACVDRATQLADDGAGRHAVLRWFFRPKKTQPFQRVPVMARATSFLTWRE
jgi:hypothetical protein